jgi:hypothetical protein
MRTVNLIQFTEQHYPDYGETPDMGRVYKVLDLNDDYYYEDEDDEGNIDEVRIDSISVRIGTRKRHFTDTQNVKYNLLTIILDEESKLFT